MKKCVHSIERKTLQWICKLCGAIFSTMDMAREWAKKLNTGRPNGYER